MMTWTRLEDTFYDNPKIIEAGNELAGVFVRSLTYCGRHLTNGRVPESVARTLAGSKRVAERMVTARLWERNGTGYAIPDYLEFNPSREEVESKQKVRSDAGKRGGSASGRTRSKRQANA